MLTPTRQRHEAREKLEHPLLVLSVRSLFTEGNCHDNERSIFATRFTSAVRHQVKDGKVKLLRKRYRTHADSSQRASARISI